MEHILILKFKHLSHQMSTKAVTDQMDSFVKLPSEWLKWDLSLIVKIENRNRQSKVMDGVHEGKEAYSLARVAKQSPRYLQ